VKNAAVLMSEHELKEAIERGAFDAERLNRWRSLSVEGGGFLLEYFRDRLGLIRGLYSRINVGDDGATAKIARVQGAEEEMLSVIEKLEDIEKYQKELDKHITDCLNELENRRKMPVRNDGIISSTIKGGKK